MMKIRTLVTTVCAVGMLAAACGDSGVTTTGFGTSPPPTTSATVPPPPPTTTTVAIPAEVAMLDLLESKGNVPVLSGLCDPTGAGGPEYVDLGEFLDAGEERDSPLGGFTKVATVPFGEMSFEVAVTGATEQAVQDFVANNDGEGSRVRVCLDAQVAPTGNVARPIVVPEAVIEAAVLAETELTPAALVQLSDDNPGASLADLVNSLTVPEKAAQIRETAVDEIRAGLDSMETDGLLTAAERATIDAGAVVDFLFNVEDAPYISDPDDLPADDAEYAAQLADDPELIVVEFERLENERFEGDVDEGQSIMNFFAVDPFVAEGDRVGFSVICGRSAWVSILLNQGKSNVKLWSRRKGEPKDHGVAWANADIKPASGVVDGERDGRARFDTRIRARTDSFYTIYGGWEEGTERSCG